MGIASSRTSDLLPLQSSIRLGSTNTIAIIVHTYTHTHTRDTHITKTNTPTKDLVPRDHVHDNKSNEEYLKAHNIIELFEDLYVRLLTERPLDPLIFLRNILIHKAKEKKK